MRDLSQCKLAWSAKVMEEKTKNKAYSNSDVAHVPFDWINTFESHQSSGVCMSTSSRASDVEESTAGFILCSVYRLDGTDTMTFHCQVPGCSNHFARWPDFLRHYNGAHAIVKKVYWCPSVGCIRSQGPGNVPFPRKDKMLDHARQVHGYASNCRT
jgi:hypothetical protein